jgi:hypothetical protein
MLRELERARNWSAARPGFAMNRSILIQSVLEYLPGIRTLLTYRLADLPDDLRAGLTVAAIAVVLLSMHTARLTLARSPPGTAVGGCEKEKEREREREKRGQKKKKKKKKKKQQQLLCKLT